MEKMENLQHIWRNNLVQWKQLQNIWRNNPVSKTDNLQNWFDVSYYCLKNWHFLQWHHFQNIRCNNPVWIKWQLLQWKHSQNIWRNNLVWKTDNLCSGNSLSGCWLMWGRTILHFSCQLPKLLTSPFPIIFLPFSVILLTFPIIFLAFPVIFSLLL